MRIVLGGVGFALRLALAAAFAYAAATKVLSRDRSREAAQGLGVPAALAPAVAIALPIAELAVAVVLVAQPSGRAGSGAAVGLLLMFSVVIAANLARGRRPSCNCFGATSSEPIGPLTLVRNGIMVAVGATVFAVGDASDPVEVVGRASTSELVVSTLLVLLAAAVAAEGWMLMNLLRQHGRLLLRFDELEGRARPKPSPAPAGLPVGAPAPEFALTGLHGETMTLAALRAGGKPVMLVFGEANCGPCTALLPDMAAWQRDHAGLLTVALVAAGDNKMNRAKATEHGLVNVLLQDGREVAESYRYSGTPGAVLIDIRGRIAAPLATGAAAIGALVERVTAGVPVALGRPKVATPSAGAPAPPISLPSLGGGEGSLAEFRGHRVVVLFWHPRCGFCRELLPRVLEWERSRPEAAPELLVISTGDEAENASEGFGATVLLDAAGQTMSAYGANGTPMAVLVDVDGRVKSGVAVGADAVMDLLNNTESFRGTLT